MSQSEGSDSGKEQTLQRGQGQTLTSRDEFHKQQAFRGCRDGNAKCCQFGAFFYCKSKFIVHCLSTDLTGFASMHLLIVHNQTRIMSFLILIFTAIFGFKPALFIVLHLILILK